MNSSRHPSHRHDLLEEVTLLEEPCGERLRCRFTGPFEDKEVEWHATLYTPAGWASWKGEAPPTQNIIEIPSWGDSATIALCLKVAAIDLPTVRKAVMMVRQYKRLQRGIHRYG